MLIIKLKFDIDINVYYMTVKTPSYFPLKCTTPFALLSNVVYKFICSCDTNITYIGMTTRHMDTRAKEYLHSKNTKSAIHDHIKIYKTCLKTEYDINSFQILRQYFSKYETKVQEALLIRKVTLN